MARRDRLVDAYLEKLEHDPSFPLPWTNIEDGSWLGDHAPVSSEPCKALGFQLMFSRIRKYPTVSKWLDDPGVRIIHMSRQNVLKKHLSILTSRTNRSSEMAAHFDTEGKKRTAYLDTATLIADLDKLSGQIESIR